MKKQAKSRPRPKKKARGAPASAGRARPTPRSSSARRQAAGGVRATPARQRPFTATAARAFQGQISSDSQVIALLMLPILVLATALAAGNALRTTFASLHSIEIAAPLPDAPTSVVEKTGPAPKIEKQRSQLATTAPARKPAVNQDPTATPPANIATEQRLAMNAPPIGHRPEIRQPPTTKQTLPPPTQRTTPANPTVALNQRPVESRSETARLEQRTAPNTTLANAAPAPDLQPPQITTGATCLPDPSYRLTKWRPRLDRVTGPTRPAVFGPDGFGKALAKAALEQTTQLVVYTAKYQSIAYPGGDIAPLYGACTDVIIRAYRTLGIDLQRLVRQAGVGTGDASIDHRRTETLRRFFSRKGTSLPVTAFPENYKPGDIVTYHRPFSSVSRSHIAIVSDIIAPTGRPMIIHNRGWGPQLEDALFVDRITGHYRYNGPPNLKDRDLATNHAPPPRPAQKPSDFNRVDLLP